MRKLLAVLAVLSLVSANAYSQSKEANVCHSKCRIANKSDAIKCAPSNLTCVNKARMEMYACQAKCPK